MLYWSQFTLFLCVLALALWQGGRPERCVAGGVLAAMLIGPLVQDRTTWMDAEHQFLLIDSVLVVLLAWLTLTTTKPWLYVATAFQLLSMLTHLAVILNVRIEPFAYLTVTIGFSYGVLFALSSGTFVVWRARRLAASGAIS